MSSGIGDASQFNVNNYMEQLGQEVQTKSLQYYNQPIRDSFKANYSQTAVNNDFKATQEQISGQTEVFNKLSKDYKDLVKNLNTEEGGLRVMLSQTLGPIASRFGWKSAEDFFLKNMRQLMKTRLDNAQKANEGVSSYTSEVQGQLDLITGRLKELHQKKVGATEAYFRQAHDIDTFGDFFGKLQAKIEEFKKCEDPQALNICAQLEANAAQIKERLEGLEDEFSLSKASIESYDTLIKMSEDFNVILANLKREMSKISEHNRNVINEAAPQIQAVSTAHEASKLLVEVTDKMNKLREGCEKAGLLSSKTALAVVEKSDVIIKQMNIMGDKAMAEIHGDVEKIQKIRDERLAKSMQEAHTVMQQAQGQAAQQTPASSAGGFDVNKLFNG